MPTYTATETNAFNAMQVRLIELLLRYDAQMFRRFYDQRSDFQALADEHATVARARELGVLFHLRDELFEHILPRIVRRLSFESPRSIIVEEPPARGRVDWERTLDATWRERPGETPLELHTRQRRRDFATPENLLTIITLLEYRRDVYDLFEQTPHELLRHPLYEIVERCERELAFPQFASLRNEAETWLRQHGDASDLETQVQARLVRGGNSAYEELLHWRERRQTLRLLQRTIQTQTTVLGADPASDNRMYELWIFYELAHMLTEQDQLIALETTSDQRHIRFHWGKPDDYEYEIRHNQAMPDPWIGWEHQPGVRVDFYLRRVYPPHNEVRDAGRRYWRETGMVWDAKYYRERDRDRAPSPPIKRMIADLTLLGESEGVLLFAFLQTKTNSQEDASEARDVVTKHGFDQTLGAAPTVYNELMAPTFDQNQANAVFKKLLDRAHKRLSIIVQPVCDGVFLDSVSVGTTPLFTRYGHELSNPHDMLICPKRHIGAWRVDLVDRQIHCLKDAHVCHIIHQPNAQLPVRPVRTAEELLKELDSMFATKDHLSDEEISIIAKRVERVTQQFAVLSGKYDLDLYRQRVRDLGMSGTLDLLGAAEQESLALGIFLLDQLDAIKANDYSAPAIYLSSVMEIQLKHTVFTCPNLYGDLANHKKHTLGTLPFIKMKPWEAQGNWERIEVFVKDHWNDEYHADYPLASFGQFVDKALNRIAQIRNNAAHTTIVPRSQYEELQKILIQGGKLGNGALNILLLAWQA